MLNLTRLNCLLTMGGVKYHPSMRSVLLSGYLAAAHADNDRNIALPYIFNGSVAKFYIYYQIRSVSYTHLR
ncbi:hypothetical protein EAX59_00920, partial [Enterococcus faecium]